MITLNPISELTQIERELRNIAKRAEDPEIKGQMEAFDRVIDRMAASWSGSPWGHQANVYYSGFQRPEPDDRFNTEFGWADSSENWVEHEPNDALRYIYDQDGCGEIQIKELIALNQRSSKKINASKYALKSIVEVCIADTVSGFTDEIKDRINGCKASTGYDFLRLWRSESQRTRDQWSVLHNDGTIPAHWQVRAYIEVLRSTFKAAGCLADLAVDLRSHLRRLESTSYSKTHASGTAVFIGHGRSEIWRVLKDFLVERLDLKVVEFNSEAQAGRTTVQRLEEMLGRSTVALLVFTGEDLHQDCAVHPRENVVHEAGLFQGRLGFEKAIVLLEEGCAELSNMAGLQHIPFPKGDVGACFEEVRRVLERESVVDSS